MDNQNNDLDSAIQVLDTGARTDTGASEQAKQEQVEQGGEPANDVSSETLNDVENAGAESTNEVLTNEIEAKPIPQYVERFFQYFSEFKDLGDSEQGLKDVEFTGIQVASLYPRFAPALKDNADLSIQMPFFMLLAHYLVIMGKAASVGLAMPSGVAQSASIDGVSVTMLPPPTRTSMQYFFGQTRYGLLYLQWLDSQSGILFVNN